MRECVHLRRFCLGDWNLSGTIVTPPIFPGNLEVLSRKEKSFLGTYLEELFLYAVIAFIHDY